MDTDAGLPRQMIIDCKRNVAKLDAVCLSSLCYHTELVKEKEATSVISLSMLQCTAWVFLFGLVMVLIEDFRFSGDFRRGLTRRRLYYYCRFLFLPPGRGCKNISYEQLFAWYNISFSFCVNALCLIKWSNLVCVLNPFKAHPVKSSSFHPSSFIFYFALKCNQIGICSSRRCC